MKKLIGGLLVGAADGFQRDLQSRRESVDRALALQMRRQERADDIAFRTEQAALDRSSRSSLQEDTQQHQLEMLSRREAGINARAARGGGTSPGLTANQRASAYMSARKQAMAELNPDGFADVSPAQLEQRTQQILSASLGTAPPGLAPADPRPSVSIGEPVVVGSEAATPAAESTKEDRIADRRALREELRGSSVGVADPLAPAPLDASRSSSSAASAAPPDAVRELLANPTPQMQRFFADVFGEEALRQALGRE